MEALMITLISIFITAILGGIGYLLRMIFEKVNLVSSDIAEMKPKLDILWKDKFAPSFSPRQLNEVGRNILAESGIREIMDAKRPKLLEAVRSLDPKNAYDAEEAISSVVDDLPKHCPDVIDQLKEGAFKVGQNIGVLLFVGSVYLRDLIFPELGYSLTDLEDKKAI